MPRTIRKPESGGEGHDVYAVVLVLTGAISVLGTKAGVGMNV